MSVTPEELLGIAGPAAPIKLKCVCCDFEQDFASRREAFDAGWDLSPAVFCNCCPSAPILLGDKHWHDEVHERWAREGRPNI